MPHRIPNIVLMLLRLLVMGLLLCSRVQGRVMTNLERQKEAAKNFENSKQKNMDLRANAREARQTLDQELARAKQLHKDRRKGLDLKREEAAKEWALKRQKEEEEAKKAAAAAKEDNSGYEYVYVDEDGNYYEVEDAEDSTEEEEDVEEVEEEVLPPSRNNRVTSSIVLDKGYSKAFKYDALFALRKGDLSVFLHEMQNKSSCLFRNISHLNRLRDDHQVSSELQHTTHTTAVSHFFHFDPISLLSSCVYVCVVES